MATGLFADFDYDADVNFTDFLILPQPTLVKQPLPVLEPAGSRVVPEPSGHLAWLMALLLVRRKRGVRIQPRTE